MTTVPFTHCCHLLAVDSKTLRQWLKQSHLSLQAHPTDGRVKCLTIEQVHLLANVHSRVLQGSAEPAAASQQQSEIATVLFPPAADLREKLAQMEVQVATLQAQLSHLTFHLLQERQQRTEQRLLALEAPFTSIGERALPPLASSAPTPPSQPETDTAYPAHCLCSGRQLCAHLASGGRVASHSQFCGMVCLAGFPFLVSVCRPIGPFERSSGLQSSSPIRMKLRMDEIIYLCLTSNDMSAGKRRFVRVRTLRHDARARGLGMSSGFRAMQKQQKGHFSSHFSLTSCVWGLQSSSPSWLVCPTNQSSTVSQ